MRQNAALRMPILIVYALAAALLCVAAIADAAAQTQAGSGDAQATALYASGLSATCAGCHGTGGRAVAGSPLSALAGLDKSYFTGQMQAFKNGARPATVMHQISRGFTDAQIESMAAYFADFAAQQK